MTASFLHGVEVLELAANSGAIVVSSTSVIGLVGTAQYADPLAFPLDTPVLVTTPAQAAKLSATAPANPVAGALGTLPSAVSDIYKQVRTPIVVVRVETDTTDLGATLLAAQMALVVGDPVAQTGCYALGAAKSLIGVKPKILCAPGFSSGLPTNAMVNPVQAALKAVAYKLRAVAVVDGENDTTADMVAMAPLIGDQRIYPVDPWPTVLSSTGAVVPNAPSAMVAGVIANSDQVNGYWWSPSNQVIQGVVGLSRPIEFGLSDATAESNTLNAAGVATIVNNGGYRLWGNRTGSIDPNWAFLCVRRTFDIIEDAVEQSYLWAVDRPFSPGLLIAVQKELNSFLRGLKARGAIIGGSCTLDPDLNTAATLAAGQFYVDFDAEPAAPLERLTFQASRNDGYYTELLTAVSSAISSTNTAAVA